MWMIIDQSSTGAPPRISESPSLWPSAHETSHTPEAKRVRGMANYMHIYAAFELPTAAMTDFGCTCSNCLARWQSTSTHRQHAQRRDMLSGPRVYICNTAARIPLQMYTHTSSSISNDDSKPRMPLRTATPQRHSARNITADHDPPQRGVAPQFEMAHEPKPIFTCKGQLFNTSTGCVKNA